MALAMGTEIYASENPADRREQEPISSRPDIHERRRRWRRTRSTCAAVGCTGWSREIPPEIEITEDMLWLQAFRVEEKEKGIATPAIGESKPLKPIYEFGASSYTEEEAKSLSEIIEAFNERNRTDFTDDDFLRFEQVNGKVLDDEDMIEMLRNNPPDVVYSAYFDAFFQEAIRMFQRDSQMKSIVLSDQQARDQAIQHFFNRALRQVREQRSA
jgi:type I restriction enzyme R subunit